LKRGLLTIGIFLLLLGGTLFIGGTIDVERTKNVEIPYTEQEAYEVEIDVTRKHHLQQFQNYEFSENWLYIESFELDDNKDITISWSSDKIIFLYCIVTQDFFGTLINTMGLAQAGLQAGGAVGPWGAIIGAALGAITGISGSFNYGKIRSTSDMTNIRIPEGKYSVVQVILNAPTTIDSEIYYEYLTKETQIRYRTVEKTRIETQLVKEPLLILPEIQGITWEFISIAFVLLGIIFVGIGFTK